MMIDLMTFSGDNRIVDKTPFLTTLQTNLEVNVRNNQNWDKIELELSYHQLRLRSANYVLLRDRSMYYYCNVRYTDDGGIIVLELKLDVLYTFRNYIKNMTATVVRNENIGINYIPDNLLPLRPEKKLRTIKFENSELNTATATDNSFNFILNVAGGGNSNTGGTDGT